jgi:tRNA (mo5U34)-methyltransferase
MNGVSPTDLRAEIAKANWYHRIMIGTEFTPGQCDVAKLYRALGLPKDLRGRRVLDIGTFDGGLAFACEARGADEVVALDVVEHKTFTLAHKALQSRVRFETGNAYNLDPARLGTFDLVIFAGVLYHLRYPLLALDRLRRVASGDVHIETHTAKIGGRRPAAVFYERDELNGDYTNWFGPNDRAVQAWFRSAGFTIRRLGNRKERIFYLASIAPGPTPILAHDWPQVYRSFEFAAVAVPQPSDSARR